VSLSKLCLTAPPSKDFFNISQSEKRINLGGHVCWPNGTKWRSFRGSYIDASCQIWLHFATKPGIDGSWVCPFQNCVRQPHPPFKMAAVFKGNDYLPLKFASVSFYCQVSDTGSVFTICVCFFLLYYQ
jgi:hypothetical protein